jgi:hypothetical protein
MKRWTKHQKELQGYRRKMAVASLDHSNVTLPKAPWDKKEEKELKNGIRNQPEENNRNR